MSSKNLPFNAIGMEVRYSFDMACLLLYQQRPQNVRIYCDNSDLVRAAVRRLGWVTGTIYVDSELIAVPLRDIPNVSIEVADDAATIDAALFLFSREQYDAPPSAKTVVTVVDNRLSYKQLLYRRQVYDVSLSVARWLQQTHAITRRVGLFTPPFLYKWTLAQYFDKRDSAKHFQWGQRAMDSIYSESPLWWTGYLSVICGIQRGVQQS